VSFATAGTVVTRAVMTRRAPAFSLLFAAFGYAAWRSAK
jgi:hypothetical protein